MLDIRPDLVKSECLSPIRLHISQRDEAGTSANSQKMSSTLCDSQEYQSSLLWQSRVFDKKSKLSLSFASVKTSTPQREHKKAGRHFCGEHNRKFTYSCMNCASHICGACLLSSSEHRNHRFKCYSQKREDLLQVEGELGARVYSKINEIGLLISNLMNQLKMKEKRQTYSLAKLEENVWQVEQQRQTKIDCFEKQKQAFGKTIQQFNRFYCLNLSALKNTDKVSFLKHMDEKYEKKLSEGIKQVVLANFEKPQINKTFKDRIKPQPYLYKFAVANFSLLHQESQQIISEPFSCFESLWRLKVYPAGYGDSKGQAGAPYMSIYIERIGGVVSRGQFCIQVQIISQADQKLMVHKDFRSEFEKSESWGYDKYTRISNIYEFGFLGTNNTLLINAFISPASYHEASRPLNQLINEKEKILHQNENKIKILKFRLEERKKQATSIKILEQKKIKPYEKAEPLFQRQVRELNCANSQIPQQCLDSFPIKKQKSMIRLGQRGALELTKGRQWVHCSSTSLEKRAPCNLIRLVSLQNSELIESSKKKYSNRCSTLY